MNILFFSSNIIKLNDLPWAFMEAGHKVKIVNYSGEFNKVSEEDIVNIQNMIKSDNYDFVLSYNFIVPLSMVCEELHIKYVSWTFDSLLLILFTETVKNECNFVFVFDRTQYDMLKKLGVPHLFYLPLAVNMSRVGALEITSQDERKYTSDISFVGNLYHGNAYNSLEQYLPEQNKLYFNSIFAQLATDINIRNLDEYVNDSMLTFFDYVLTDESKNHYLLSDKQFYADKFLARKISEIDRTNILNLLGKYFKIDLYTDNDTSMLNNVNVHPSVSYENIMPKIFYLSKINLNMTIRAIKTGMPLRMFDIMGSGGFLMTNYQEDLFEFFEPGKDLEVYNSIDELVIKSDYYLRHDTERQRIAINGYMKVSSEHTYQKRLQRIIDCINR